ncbi:MAG: DUF3224 domain-containing protein [Thermoplasmata archaeon]|nr:DUF3224 domain-containing protein [Thermoplasmata archaeon]
MEPQGAEHKAPGSTLGRMSIRKNFHGDLEATSRGEMLTAMTDVEGSAAYVALEQVNGTLGGRTGAFVLHHSGTMTRGAPKLVLVVVPDSGCGELEGLEGAMQIEIVDGEHSYVFEYQLPSGTGPAPLGPAKSDEPGP